MTITILRKFPYPIILFSASVTQSSMTALALTLERVERVSIAASRPPMIVITSNGGDLDAVRCGYSCIRQHKATTHARGLVGSAGVVLFSAGLQRDIDPCAKLLVHEPKFTIPPSVSLRELNDYLKGAKRDREFYCDAIFGKSNLPFRILSEREIDASEAVKFGLADQIVMSFPPI